MTVIEPHDPPPVLPAIAAQLTVALRMIRRRLAATAHGSSATDPTNPHTNPNEGAPNR